MSTRLAAAVLELVEALRAEMQENAPRRNDPPALLDVADAAEVLGIGRTTLYGLLDKPGGVRTLRVGRRRLIARSDLDAFANRRGVAA